MQTQSGQTAPMTRSARHGDIKDMAFERALKELEHIVGRLERGDVELEESITIYERGEALRDHCDKLRPRSRAGSSPTSLPIALSLSTGSSLAPFSQAAIFCM